VTSTGSEPSAGDAPAVWLLAVGQTIGFACMIYAFGALIVPVSAGTGWSKADLALGLTLALVIAAACAPLSGRLVDHGWGAELLAGGAILGGLSLMLVSRADTLAHWYIAWALVGPAMAASLYETCFSFLTRRLGQKAARPAIIRVTLIAGLASTIAFPLGAFVSAGWGWRTAYATFGALDLCLAAPLMFYAGRRLRRRERVGEVRRPDPPGMLRLAVRRPAFWLVTLAFSTVYLNLTMLVTYFIPLFTDLGASPAMAVAAASTVGPFQVIGRLGMMLMGSRAQALTVTRAALAAMVVASLFLLASGFDVRLIFAFAVLQGSGIGLTSILRPLLTAEQLGTEGFGAISGAMTIGPLLATAVAPLVGAWLLGFGGTSALMLGGLVAALVGFALTLVLRPRPA
jgi:predicted MFS family arabinose efflux permease